jgi:hypothetical protein
MSTVTNTVQCDDCHIEWPSTHRLLCKNWLVLEDCTQIVLIFTVFQLPIDVFYFNIPTCLPCNKSLNVKISIEHWCSNNSGTKLHGEKLSQCPVYYYYYYYYYYCYYYLTAIGLTPSGSSIHLHTNSTQNTEDGTHITITREKNNYKEK